MNEKFSVSMCVYRKDNPEHFKAAADSVLNQTCPPDEVVLVVDGPIGEELEAALSEYEKRADFKVIRLPKNEGHGNARRESLKNCSNELVALMDADDISASNRFEILLSMFKEDNELAVAGGNITEFEGEIRNTVGKRVVPESDGEIKEYLKKRCPMNQVTVMFKKSAVDLAGGYIDWFCEEDYYLWIRMAEKGFKFRNSSETLVFVRTDTGMYSRRGGIKYFKSEKGIQRLLLERKIIGKPRYLINVTERFIVQVILPDKLREFVFKRFARK